MTGAMLALPWLLGPLPELLAPGLLGSWAMERSAVKFEGGFFEAKLADSNVDVHLNIQSR